MITAAQMRAARALLGMDQKTLADRAGVSLPTIQRMEASEGHVRGVVDTLAKVVEALERDGIDLIGDGSRSETVDAAYVCGNLRGRLRPMVAVRGTVHERREGADLIGRASVLGGDVHAQARECVSRGL